MFNKFNKADYCVLPLAFAGAVQGLLRYFVISPINEHIESFIESRSPSQAEIDKLIGEQAMLIFQTEDIGRPLSPGKMGTGD